MENISKNISYKEATHSNTAKARKIDNTPDADTIVRMKLVAKKCFQPLREWYGKPIKINSFYRSEKLNIAIGGAKKSQHMKGEAIDLTAGSVEENRKLYNWICENLEFDQAIWEYGGRWIHISYKMNGNRNMKFNIN
jgi:zinc D-Ala-D-Ala carboxypeptidase